MKNDELEKIYTKYYKELYIYAFSICKNHHIAEEVISDTFFKAFLSIDQCEGHIKYLLLKICRNTIIDYYRKEKRRSFIPLEDEILKINDNTIDKIIISEDRKRLYELILTLKDTYREAIVMFYFMDMSNEEIAKQLNISNGAVRNLLYRGRKKVGELIRGSHIEV